ncbi:uncharacterized protein [Rhodnius prolixus]|uniref:uncharacterized protein n=1 Tax=Rhodnius prolixus TaxID=13249 RepID=UPI003D18802E
MDDEFLRSLWQPSETDSFFDYWDPEAKDARKEVMKQLGEMMTSAPCPREGENTSNLYRMLVKKLREQISNFDSNPEVVDLATKKLAKWVENLVKEAYYRKQGKIGAPRPKEVKGHSVSEVDKRKLQVINLQKDTKKLLQENILNRHQNEADGKQKVDVKIRKRPNFINKKGSSARNEMAKSFTNLDFSPGVDESDLITQTNNLRIDGPDKTHMYMVDQDTRGSRNHSKPRQMEKEEEPRTEEPSVSAASVNSCFVENKSSSHLVKNWSSWMVNLTRKAKNFVKWDASIVNVIENVDEKEPTNSVTVMQEKWDKMRTENVANKLRKNQSTTVGNSEEEPSRPKCSTSESKDNRN